MTFQRLLKTLVLPALLFLWVSAAAQSIQVAGKVTDSKTGAGLAGVTVQEKGTQNGTSTDAEGNYSMKVATNAVLVFSSVGFTAKEVVASAAGTINVTLDGTASALNEVVVIGYGSAKKKDLTGAVATVSSKDFQKGTFTTPEQMIAGKVAGVQITSNGGRPGAGSTIRIRGGSSLAASNDPLIVIDGVPLDNNGVQGAANPLSFINPNDIESYTILKDASAAAIYGSRANNGVIIITTKKGKAGKLKVFFNSINSVSEITKQVDVLSADEIRSVVNQFGSASQKAQLGTASTNWQDQIYQTGFATDNNVSLSGGIKGLPYRVSLGYLYQTGVLKTDELKRTSLALALNPTFFDRHLKVDLNVKTSAQQTRFANDGAIGTAVGFDPTQPVYANNKYGGFYEWVDASGNLLLVRPNNPLGLLENNYDEQNPRRLIGNIQADYKFHFLPELRAVVNVAYDLSKSTGTGYVPAYAASNYLTGGSSSESRQERKNTVFDGYLNYVKDIKSIKSRVDATAGYTYNNFWTKNYNIRSLNAKGDTIAGSSAPNFAYDIPENTLISYFGRLLFNYDSRYYLTATLRRDGSSKFSEANRWGWFPSVGFAWSIRNEAFMSNANTVSDLKLRFGYGSTGQQDGIGNYDYLARYGYGGQSVRYQFGNTFYNTYEPFGYNENLKWEVLESYNIALDFGLFENRITGSVDFYQRNSKDLLNSIPQATGTNFSPFVVANVGSLRNRGVEFSVNANVVKTKDVSWDVNFNTTYNDNEITNLTVIPNDSSYKGIGTGNAAGANGFVQLHQVGYTRNTFNLFRQIYDGNGKPIEGLFEDRNRDGIINSSDRYLNHSAVPDWTFGLSSNVSYKKFSLSFVARASLNNYVYNNVFSNIGRRNSILGTSTLGNASGNFRETGFIGGSDLQPLSDYYVENASFLRMDNIVLNYNVGKLKHVNNLSLSASVQNVFIITEYKGLDPEHAFGIDNNLYPRPRIFALSLNLDL